MSLKSLVLGGLAAITMATAAHAAPIVMLTLKVDDDRGTASPGRYTIYASDSTGDNLGIASYSTTLKAGTVNGPGSANINTSTGINQSPRWIYQDSSVTNNDINAGFNLLRGAANEPVNGELQYTGSQDNIDSPHRLISGMGQLVDSAANHIPSGYDTVTTQNTNGTATTASAAVMPTSWGTPMIIATGSYPVGQTPAFSTLTASTVNVFLTNDGTNATSTGATVQTQVIAAPEPASIGLLAVVGVGLIRRRRRVA